MMSMLGLPAQASYLDGAKDSHGCRVLLCLAAVGGSPSECLKTLRDLAKDLARGKSFPECEMQDSPPVFADQGVRGTTQEAPTTIRGSAAFIPAHTRCVNEERKMVGVGKNASYETVCTKSEAVEEHYAPDKHCSQYFTPPERGYFSDDPLWNECREKSKKYVKVEHPGVQSEYFYY